MESLEEFKALCAKFHEAADFVTIYVAEAHPYESGDLTDEYKFRYNTHDQMEDRIVAAHGLQAEFKVDNCPILVDLMDDHANKAYGAMPERLYIILDNKIVYVGGYGPFYYNVKEVDKWLDDFVKKQ